MAGFTDLLGSILQQGMGATAGKRMGNAIERDGGDSLEGLLGKLAKEMGSGSTSPRSVPEREYRRPEPSAPPSAGRGDPLGGLLGQVLGGLGDNRAVVDGIGSLLESILGGGQQSARGSMGGGGLA